MYTCVYIYILSVYPFDFGWLSKTREIYQGIPSGRSVRRCLCMLHLTSYVTMIAS